MAASPTGIIPEAWMNVASRKAVILWLIGQALPAGRKRALLFGWARVVGVQLTRDEIAEVEQSGVRT